MPPRTDRKSIKFNTFTITSIFILLILLMAVKFISMRYQAVVTNKI